MKGDHGGALAGMYYCALFLRSRTSKTPTKKTAEYKSETLYHGLDSIVDYGPCLLLEQVGVEYSGDNSFRFCSRPAVFGDNT